MPADSSRRWNERTLIPAASAALSTEELNAGRGLVGTGAFRFREWRINEYVLLEKNPDWWGGPVAWDRVQLRAIPEAGARVAAGTTRVAVGATRVAVGATRVAVGATRVAVGAATTALACSPATVGVIT